MPAPNQRRSHTTRSKPSLSWVPGLILEAVLAAPTPSAAVDPIQPRGTPPSLGSGAGDEVEVAISDNGLTLLASDFRATSDTGAPNAGEVRVYDWDGTNWTQRGSTLYGQSAGAQFGLGLALSADGNTFIARSPGDGGGTGQLRVFDWVGTAWQQRGRTLNAESSLPLAVGSIAISADGNTIGYALEAAAVVLLLERIRLGSARRVV